MYFLHIDDTMGVCDCVTVMWSRLRKSLCGSISFKRAVIKIKCCVRAAPREQCVQRLTAVYTSTGTAVQRLTAVYTSTGTAVQRLTAVYTSTGAAVQHLDSCIHQHRCSRAAPRQLYTPAPS